MIYRHHCCTWYIPLVLPSSSLQGEEQINQPALSSNLLWGQYCRQIDACWRCTWMKFIMSFTAFHSYFHSFLVKDGMSEILLTQEREGDLCLSGLFENSSLYNKHSGNVQVRGGILCSNSFLYYWVWNSWYKCRIIIFWQLCGWSWSLLCNSSFLLVNNLSSEIFLLMLQGSGT